jgi:hypothetical protein
MVELLAREVTGPSAAAAAGACRGQAAIESMHAYLKNSSDYRESTRIYPRLLQAATRV